VFPWKSVEGGKGNALYLCSETRIESIFLVCLQGLKKFNKIVKTGIPYQPAGPDATTLKFAPSLLKVTL